MKKEEKITPKVKTKQKKLAKQPLAVFAYESIVRRIICLEYKPSQHLEENQLMEDLGIGRTPIREALVRLQGEKMVESHPNRGMIVRPITLQNTKAMFESMLVFERGAATISVKKDCCLAIQKMKADNITIKEAVQDGNSISMVEANHLFHLHFAEASQNDFMIRAIQDVRNEAKRLSFLSYNTVINTPLVLAKHYTNVIREHEQIIAFLEAKDLVPLKELLQAHIESFRNRIIQFMLS